MWEEGGEGEELTVERRRQRRFKKKAKKKPTKKTKPQKYKKTQPMKTFICFRIQNPTTTQRRQTSVKTSQPFTTTTDAIIKRMGLESSSQFLVYWYLSCVEEDPQNNIYNMLMHSIILYS